MEEQLRTSCENALKAETLASARSLIINPSTSPATLSSLFQTLARLLSPHPHHPLLPHALNLLSSLTHSHTHFTPLVFALIREHSLLDSDSTQVAAQCLDLIATVASRDRSLASDLEEIGEGVFLSLCFRPCVSVRCWLLLNADRFCVRPSVLVTVFLGFTKDPYPYVRRASLEGLVSLWKDSVFEDRGLIEGCYCRAVELLGDGEDCIRLSAIRAVSEWGLKLVALHEEKSRRDWSDAVFIQICSMVRDMNMKVRVETFDALGRMQMVSEGILLQTLSKKVLQITEEQMYLGWCFTKEFEKQALNMAGAFVHGLEDEYYEVRSSACHSLQTLIFFSANFAGDALNLLMDVLNDDSMVVRLQALETMDRMATCGYMKVQGTHMHMFLGTLLDNSTLIRSEARKILRSLKLRNIRMFKSCIDGLLENLDIYPQDEADIFLTLFKIGQGHRNFVLCIIKDAFPETESSSEGNLDLDSTRVAALLVLGISTALSCEKPVCSAPPRIFCYAAAFLGRFSRALGDIMSQGTFLAYLSCCSRSTIGADNDSKEADPFLPLVEGDISNHASIPFASPMVEYPSVTYDEVANSLNIIFAKIKDLWPLIQSGRITEVKRTLRSCKEHLATFTTDSLDCDGSAAFTSLYIQVVKLLTEACEHFLPPTELFSCNLGDLDLTLGKLYRILREMRCNFAGLRKEDELHILELILVTNMLRLPKAESCQFCPLLKKLSSTISHAKFLCDEESIGPSNFVVELEQLLNKAGTSTEEDYNSPFIFKNLLGFFSLKQFVLCRNLKHLNAELGVPGYDSLNPLPFIPGLPVGIPFEISLYNVLSENRLWLRMTVSEELKQFFFLDPDQYIDSDGVRKLTFTAPFYRTPKSVSFKLWLSIGIECGFEEVHFFKGCRGPKHELAPLCEEKEVYFSMVNKY